MIENLPLILSMAYKWAHVGPRPYNRLARTEKLWFYRAYQGGEPYSLVDWKQSGRADTLFVREHEPLQKRPLFMWTSPDEGNERIVALLMALAHWLVADDRMVGWLCARPVAATLIKAIEEQCGLIEDENKNPYLQEARLPVASSCLCLAFPFSQNEELWAARLRLFAAQGGRGILIDLGETGLLSTGPLASCARHLDWPVFSLKEKKKPEDLLPDIHEQALRLTL